MRYFCLSLFCLLMACAAPIQQTHSAQVVDCMGKLKPDFRSDWYNAQVDVSGRHISGLILFKSMADSSVRVVFTNEAGITYFDFGFHLQGDFIVHKIIRQLNRKPVVRTLKKDFEMVLMEYVGRGTATTILEGGERRIAFTDRKQVDYVVTDPDCSKLIRLEHGSAKKKKTSVFLFGRAGQAPDSISVRHHNFDMSIQLKRLPR
jgi:hypothetical protein